MGPLGLTNMIRNTFFFFLVTGALFSVLLSADSHAAGGARLAVVSGDSQVSVIGSQLGEALSVRVTDESGKPLADVEVVFSVVAGNLEPSALGVKTDHRGLARFNAEPRSYGAHRVAATVPGSEHQGVLFNIVATGWMSTLAGDGIRAYGGDDGPALEAQLNAPFGMGVRDGQLLVVDYFNHVLRSIDLDSGTIRRLAGTGKQGFNGDGLPALETVLNGPFSLTLGPGGEVVFSDYYNNQIRKIDLVTNKVVTLAGTGVAGYSGDGGDALEAKIDVPLDIAADAQGNIYLSDWHHHVVRRLDVKTGKISRVAGTGRRSYNGEGNPRAATLATPLGLSFDSQDNLYIADFANHRVRKIDAGTGRISTVAGTGEEGFSGDGGQATSARIAWPYNVYADSDGGLFISEAGSHRIRHVDLESGIISTIAGNGDLRSSDGNRLATAEPLAGPFAIIKDEEQNLYIAEYFGQRIRKVSSQRQPAVARLPRLQRLQRQAQQIFSPLPDVATSVENPLSPAKVKLGDQLFHDARLSRDGTVSCSSCHALDEYGMDGLPVAIGIDEQAGPRNTPTVFNAALQDSQFWDGRVESVESLVREPILNPLEMGMPDEEAIIAAVLAGPEYGPLFAAVFPGEAPAVTMQNISLAVGAFLRQLTLGDTVFDRYLTGDSNALSSQQLTGLEVFLREGCASCHAGPLLGGQDIHLMHNYPDTPAGDRFEFRKRLGNVHKFKVSPLRNITRTAPYLHDGRYATLEQSLGARLEAYMVREALIRDTVRFREGELDALIAFLEALTSSLPDKEHGLARQGVGAGSLESSRTEDPGTL